MSSSGRVLSAAVLMVLISGAAGAQNAAPPNGPGELKLGGGVVQLRYNGTLVFDGQVKNPEGLRERLPRPQLVATNRHITGGGADLIDLAWKDGVLSGRSRVVGGDSYELYLTEPAGWQLADVQFEGGTPIVAERQGELVKTGCRSEASREIAWGARFQQK